MIVKMDLHVVLFIIFSLCCSMVDESSHVIELLKIRQTFQREGLNAITLETRDELTPSSMCSPYDSCSNRCREVNHGLPFVCSCDKFCSFFSDCCIDYEIQCGNADAMEDIQSLKKSEPECLHIQSIPLPVFVIRTCESAWNAESTNEQLLELKKNCPEIQTSHCSGDNSMNCSNEFTKQCKHTIRSKCEVNNSNTTQMFEFVRDSNMFIYLNPSCAICNHQTEYEKVNMQEHIAVSFGENRNTFVTQLSMRSCFQKKENCLYPGGQVRNQSLNDLCEKHSGPVVSSAKEHTQTHSGGTEIYYRNIFCAFCNGEILDELSCPSWVYTQQSSVLNSLQTFLFDEHAHVDSVIHGSLPAAFSILLNFGLDGQQRMIFSSEDEEAMRVHQKICGINQIWDPFSEICRKLYCSTDFILVNFQCVRKPKEEVTDSSENSTRDPGPVAVELEFIHLTLTVEMELLDVLKYYGKENNITNLFALSISNRFNINLERIRNVKINITLGNITDHFDVYEIISGEMDEQLITFSIDFDLYEPDSDENESEPDNNNIISLMASSISEETLNVFDSNTTGKVLGIQQSVDSVKLWCATETDGIKREYKNSEFSFIMDEEEYNNTIKSVYVFERNRYYEKGEFIAYILYQVSDITDDLLNVSRLVIVCDKEKLNDSCTRILLEQHEYNILPNGSLEIKNASARTIIDNNDFEIVENNSALACFRFQQPNFSYDEYYLEMDISQVYVSLVLLCTSVFSLAAVLMTYALFPSLRNLPGCNTMNLTLSLLAMQITFLLSQRESVTGIWCRATAKLLHYEILCSFAWMNIMAFDLYKTFGGNSALMSVRSKSKYLLQYMIYAYGIPIIIIIICTLLDIYDENMTIAPRYGHNNRCWLTNRYAAFAFFALPLALIMIINFLFYFITVKAMRAVKHIHYLTGNRRSQPGWKDVILYARMAFVTGLTWTLAFVAAYVRSDSVIGQIVIYLFIIFNTLQGVFLFFVFVFNRRVGELYMGLIRKILKHGNCDKTSEIIQGIARSISRTISTETTTSTTSNTFSKKSPTFVGETMVKQKQNER